MRFKPSGINHDLRDLRSRFPHVEEGTIKQKYLSIFRGMARDASCKLFLHMLAKRYTREELETEYPPPKPVFEKVVQGTPVRAVGKVGEKPFRAKINDFFGKFGKSGGLATE